MKKIKEDVYIEKKFVSNGFNCFILFVMGHRCGYVEIPKDHVFYWKGDNDREIFDLDVHGGVTFWGNYRELGEGHFLGFDCNHSCDSNDLSTMHVLGMEFPKSVMFFHNGGTVWTAEMVETELRKLAEQLPKGNISSGIKCF